MSEDASQNPPVSPVRKGSLGNQGAEAGKQGNSSGSLMPVANQLLSAHVGEGGVQGNDAISGLDVDRSRDNAATAFERAKSVTVETAQHVASEFAALDRPERLKLVKAFRAVLIPRKAPGRKRRKEITAAYADWKLGMKGLPLYRKHIPGFEKLSHWRRREKSRALMDAIRTRQRRERRRRESECRAVAEPPSN